MAVEVTTDLMINNKIEVQKHDQAGTVWVVEGHLFVGKLPGTQRSDNVIATYSPGSWRSAVVAKNGSSAN